MLEGEREGGPVTLLGIPKLGRAGMERRGLFGILRLFSKCRWRCPERDLVSTSAR